MLETCPRLLELADRQGVPLMTGWRCRSTGNGAVESESTVYIDAAAWTVASQSQSVSEWVQPVQEFSEVTRTSDIRQIKDEAADRTASGRLARSTHGWVSLFIWNFYIFPQSFPDFSELPKEAMTYYHRSHKKALERTT